MKIAAFHFSEGKRRVCVCSMQLDTGFVDYLTPRSDGRGLYSFIVAKLLPFVTMRSVQPVPTCVKTFCDRCRLDEISSAKFARNKRVEILKLEFPLPV